MEPGYFSALRIPLIAGRDFGVDDREGGEPVAIVGEPRRAGSGPARMRSGGSSSSTSPVRASAGDTTPDRGRRARRRVSRVSTRRRAAGGTPFALYVPLQQRFMPQVSILVRRTAAASPATSTCS